MLSDMDADTLRATLPAVGGLLALVGGVFTFVSGRLRDAPDERAKAQVISAVWYWAAVVLWCVGAGILGFSKYPIAAIPFLLVYVGIHWVAFLGGPEPVSRRDVAMFVAVVSAALTTITAALSFQFARDQLELTGAIIEAIKARK
jgi:hypothetical protein